jgi:hypothetical protein
LRNARSSAAAYTLIDISGLPKELQDEIVQDAAAGGADYGVRVVEESVNGAARAPLYGVYKGEDEERWTEAKKELGISASKVDDADVSAASGPDADPRREAALREAAAQRAAAEADRIRASEDAEVVAVTGTDHPTNIVDTGLSEDAENRVEDAENQEGGHADRPAKASKSKTPR